MSTELERCKETLLLRNSQNRSLATCIDFLQHLNREYRQAAKTWFALKWFLVLMNVLGWGFFLSVLLTQ